MTQTPIQFPLSQPQYEFASATCRHPAFCAGFGAGKTIAGVVRTLLLKCKYPKLDQGYYFPTYDLVRSVGYPAFFEVMDAMGVAGELNKGDRVIEVFGAGNVIFRSMDDPARIVGYKHADAVADELDTLPTDKARDVYRKILSRNRQKKPDGAVNTCGVVSTPEGFRFLYENWQRSPIEGCHLIRASTYSNRRNLPADFIPQLLANYPTNLVQAYLMGLFVNLTTGSVYPEFNRALNDTKVVMDKKETLHVGMDFNVANMTAVFHVTRDGEPHGIDELVKVFDTPAMIESIKERYPDHPIMIYPDASGNARKSNNASVSDISLLKQAGFTVCVNTKNPAVKDRVISTRTMIHNKGARRYRISQDRCPHTVEAFEKQAYDANGEPDKTTGHDHPVDACGYYISYRWPIKRPTSVITSLRM